MSRGINKVILIGHLGADPEFRVTPNNVQVANLRLATTEQWKDRQSGEQQQRTEWHRVVLFNGLAEIANDYCAKGKQIYLEGKLQTRKWRDQQGNDRYTTEVVGNDMQLLGGGQQGPSTAGRSHSGPGPASRGNGHRQGQNGDGGTSARRGQRRSRPETAPAEPVGDPVGEGFGDDIPF